MFSSQSRISLRDMVFCLASMALGVFAFVRTQEVAAPTFEPILAVCQNPNVKDVTDLGYHEYIAKYYGFGVLDALVCLLTQFMVELKESGTAGCFVWMGTLMTIAPIYVLRFIEAGRKDAKGPIRYPGIMGFMDIVLGISVIFPLVWIPSYILGRGKGGVSQLRVAVALAVSLPLLLVSAGVFAIEDTHSRLWLHLASMLASPVLPLLLVAVPMPLLPYLSSAGKEPHPNDTVAARKSAEWSSLAFATAGVVALLGWLILMVLVCVPAVGTSPSVWYRMVWTDANASVRFMAIDFFVFWVACLLLLGYSKAQSAVEGTLLTFMFGPGAAVSLVLAGLQVDDSVHTQTNATKSAANVPVTPKKEKGGGKETKKDK